MEQQPAKKEPWYNIVLAIVIGVPVLLALAALAIWVSVKIVVAVAPIVIALFVWVICFYIVAKESPPYRYGRFAFALLVAWVVDALLFRFFLSESPGGFRHFVPGIVVASLFAGYVAWQSCWTEPVDIKPSDYRLSSHPYSGRLSFFMMVFVMFYVVMPMFVAFFPQYSTFWSDAINAFTQGSDTP